MVRNGWSQNNLSGKPVKIVDEETTEAQSGSRRIREREAV